MFRIHSRAEPMSNKYPLGINSRTVFATLILKVNRQLVIKITSKKHLN